MNITTFKSLVKTYNKAEERRLNNLSSSHYKFLINKYSIGIKNINESNVQIVWNTLNEVLAEEDKFHRKQTHDMKYSKSSYQDYSHLAYNNVTDDF